MKMWKKWKGIEHTRIQKRFFWYFVISMLIPTLALGFFGINTLMNNEIRKTRETTMRTMGDYSQQLGKLLGEALQVGMTVANDPGIIDMLRVPEERNDRTADETSVSNSLMKTSSYFDDDIQVYLFTETGLRFKSGSNSYREEDFYGTEWYSLIMDNDSQIWFDLYSGSYVTNSMKDYFISVGIPLKTHPSGANAGVLLVEVCIDELLLNDEYGDGVWFLYNPNSVLRIEENRVMQYEDEKTTILYPESYEGYSELNARAAAVAENIAYWSYDFPEKNTLSVKGYEILYEQLPVNNWILVCGISHWDFYRSLYLATMAFIGLLLLILFGALLLSQMMASRVTRPILQLTEGVSQIRSGNFDVTISVDSHDEIGELAEQFDEMVRHIRRLMKEIVTEQETRRNYELMLLNAQINPHFLYNTLDSLMWLIRGRRLDDAENMLQQLTSFFKTGLNNGKDIIVLKQEIENVRSYLAIQKLRYKSKLNYEVFLDPQAEEVELPKLILQPLVENSIYHGIKPKENGGSIFVWCFMRDNRLILQVRDNGVGMEEEKLLQIRKNLSSMKAQQRENYGLENVNERLHLFFKEQYAFHMESKKDMGTEIVITIGQE